MFDAITYFTQMAEHNKLAKKEGFKPVVISNTDNLEGLLEDYRDNDRFIAISDTNTGNLTSPDGAYGFTKRRAFTVFCALVLVFCSVLPALAADDPIAVVNNLSDFIFGLIRAVGIILLGFGVLQLGLSLKSHDPSQRANGMLTLAGGIVITFTKEILNLITG